MLPFKEINIWNLIVLKKVYWISCVTSLSTLMKYWMLLLNTLWEKKMFLDYILMLIKKKTKFYLSFKQTASKFINLILSILYRLYYFIRKKSEWNKIFNTYLISHWPLNIFFKVILSDVIVNNIKAWYLILFQIQC